MRPSQLKHPVAVLRKIIGMGQKELADLVGCTVSTIQSIELGPNRLRLSPELAERISFETGACVTWLLEGDPQKPPKEFFEAEFTKETYEDWRVALIERDTVQDAMQTQRQIYLLVAEVCNVALHAFKNKRVPLLQFRSGAALAPLKKEFGYDQSLTDRMMFEYDRTGFGDQSPDKDKSLQKTIFDRFFQPVTERLLEVVDERGRAFEATQKGTAAGKVNPRSASAQSSRSSPAQSKTKSLRRSR
jgi:transcriptional regulator with XRE-family HTH domain